MNNNCKDFANIKKLVIKIGTSSLINENKLDLEKIDKLSMILSDLKNKGLNTALVTSGAIGVGMSKLGLKERPKNIKEKQALAAIGQGILMHIYEEKFSQYGSTVAQILLTKDIFEDPKKKNNSINTLETLFKYNIIPIINENDTVATEEIEFGDNDILSAYVAKLIKADLLIILTNIDGLYKDNPNKNPDAELIKSVRHIDENIENLAYNSSSVLGTGGMISKIQAAKIATRAGIDVVIANSNKPENIYQILKGEKIGTLFHSVKPQQRTKEEEKDLRIL